MKSIEAKLRITYSWDPNVESGVDLVSLGESLIGFDRIIREQIHLLRLHGESKIEVKRGGEGSVIVDLLVQLHATAPFSDWQSYVDLMMLAGHQIPGAAANSLESLKDAHQSVNDFVARYPLDAVILQGALLALWRWGQHQKNAPITHLEDKWLPTRYAGRLKKLIREHKYKKALSPIINDSAREITLSVPNKDSFTIDMRNFANYLSEDQRILPEFENGSTYEFTGEIVGLESSKGEYLKFKGVDLPKQHRLLTAYPEGGKTTLEYTEFYKQKVLLTAEVVRKSDYQRPKLKIEKIELVQPDLN